MLSGTLRHQPKFSARLVIRSHPFRFQVMVLNLRLPCSWIFLMRNDTVFGLWIWVFPCLVALLHFDVCICCSPRYTWDLTFCESRIVCLLSTWADACSSIRHLQIVICGLKTVHLIRMLLPGWYLRRSERKVGIGRVFLSGLSSSCNDCPAKPLHLLLSFCQSQYFMLTISLLLSSRIII